MMLEWQSKALELHRQGLSYKEIANYICNAFGHSNLDDTYQIIRRFIYKWNMRHGSSDETSTETAKQVNIYPDGKCIEQTPTQSTIEYKQDGTVISERLIQIIEARSKDVRYILEAHGFNADEWDVVSCRNNIWGGNNSEEAKVSCQSKITVKPKARKELTEENITSLFAKLDREFKPVQYVRYKTDAKYIAVINAVDFHMGKLCWHGDTRDDYDIKIAQKIWTDIITDIYAELYNHHEKIEYILFNWAHDFFHIDNEQNTTTHGTPQDVDGRLTKIFNAGCELLIQAVDQLVKIAPVKTFWCKSNHDTVHGYHALCFLNAWYRHNKDVEVNTDAYPRKYYEYGNNLIGFSHGADEKKKNLPMLMPLEEPSAWGRTKYRYFELAHLHSEYATEETNGILIERLSSPTASDAWHVDSGYIGATRKITTHIYDKEFGRKYTINTVVRG